ncbi:terminase small subunit [Apilactobacillus timberlakei]|nr:terminase small subunit [Apilactobacillus timberlakei]
MLVITSIATEMRYEKFVDAYLKTKNGTKAAIIAGYSPKTARTKASQLLQKKDIQAKMKQHVKAMQDEDIASEKDIMQLYTRILHGEEYEEVATAGGTYITMPSLKDRMKAGDMIGRYRGIWRDPKIVNTNINSPVKIIDDVEESDNA